MKKWRPTLYLINITILAMIMIFSQQMVGYAEHTIEHQKEARDVHKENWEHLNQLAEETLFLVKKNEYAASKKRLHDLSEYFLSIEAVRYVQRVEQAHLLLETIVMAKESLAAVNPDSKEAYNSVLKMRMALDAVSHKKQPLWINYYPRLAQNITDLQYALENNNRDQFYRVLSQLSTNYELVRPSIYMSHPQEVVGQLDSQLTYLVDNQSKLWQNKDHTTEMIGMIEHQVKLAFFQETNDSTQSLLWLIIGVGTLICSVLSYVAWKKYKGEREQKTVDWKTLRQD